MVEVAPLAPTLVISGSENSVKTAIQAATTAIEQLKDTGNNDAVMVIGPEHIQDAYQQGRIFKYFLVTSSRLE